MIFPNVYSVIKKLFLFLGLTFCLHAESNLTVVDVMTLDPNFSTFITALNVAGMITFLEIINDVTVLAPTNAAFDATDWKDLLKPENLQKLQTLLKYHILPMRMNEFRTGEIKTLMGKKISVQVNNQVVKINETQITLPGEVGTNGLIYAINATLSAY